jgi:hypothetical protein
VPPGEPLRSSGGSTMPETLTPRARNKKSPFSNSEMGARGKPCRVRIPLQPGHDSLSNGPDGGETAASASHRWPRLRRDGGGPAGGPRPNTAAERRLMGSKASPSPLFQRSNIFLTEVNFSSESYYLGPRRFGLLSPQLKETFSWPVLHFLILVWEEIRRDICLKTCR